MDDNYKHTLTADEKQKVTFGHLHLGIPQQQLAALFKVNQGRVAEVIKAARTALETDPTPDEPTTPKSVEAQDTPQ